MAGSTVTNVRERWVAVGDRLEALGLKLALHHRQERSRDEQGAEAADAGALEDGLVRAGRAIGDAFEALAEAIADPAVRSDVREAGRLLVEAVDATFDEAGAAIRRRTEGN